MSKVSKHRSIKNRILFLALLIALVLGISTFILHTYLFGKQKVDITANQYTKGGSSNNLDKGNPSGNVTSTSQSRKSSSGSSSGVNVTLLTPIGDFVSNHHPNLSSTPAPNTLTSVCTTTPGATCRITFTMDNITKSLPTQTTDPGGSTYWYWKLQDYGLTVGSWKIQAVATLDGQSKTSIDAMNLVVSK